MKFCNSLLICTLLLLSGCASIVSKSNWPFSVDTQPAGAKVIITNKKGTIIYTGRTPAAMRLKSGAGFFSKESYTVALSMNGYESKKIQVECKLNAWYFGNIVFGGLLGILIVDPATGAMYKLDSDGLSEEMTRATGTAGLNIMDKNNIPENWKNHLVKID